MKKSNSQIYNIKKKEIFINENIVNNNTSINNNRIRIDQKLKLLESQNTLLKKKLKLFIQKEKYYLSEIKKLKTIQIEYELTYKNINKEKKINNKIKQIYLINKKTSQKLNNDIDLLYQEIFHKNEMIMCLQKKIYSLNKKIEEDKINFYFQEKEYENAIMQEKNKLKEIELIVNQITNEASKTIKNLSYLLENNPKIIKYNEFTEIIKNHPNLKIVQQNINQLIQLMNQENNNINMVFNNNLNKNIY